MDDDDAWLPPLTTDDRLLVRDYIVAGSYPPSAVESVAEWPISELRHLLANARGWKAAEAQRAADHAECDRQLEELGQRRAENRAVVERLYRDQAIALLARDAERSLIMLTAREARRSASGNHIDGNPGLDIERHLRVVAAERGFATGPPHWDRASKRVLIDLYQVEAESWWNSGEARGLVRVLPDGKVLASKRTYCALYPFQRAAINAGYLKSHDRSDATPDPAAAEPAPISVGGARPHGAANVSRPPLKEPVHLPEPGSSSAHDKTSATPTPAATAPSPPAAIRPELGVGLPAANKPATIPNARKGYKLTLWVSGATDLGLADVHGLLQLDGADPIPFCQLKNVDKPLARALQEAFVAVERTRAKPPKMTAPAAASQALAPATSRPSPNAPRTTPHKTAPTVPSTAPGLLSAGSTTRSKLPAAQPSLF